MEPKLTPEEALVLGKQKGHKEEYLKAVLTDPTYVYHYAIYVLKGHDERLLKAVLPDLNYAVSYAKDVLHGHDERVLKAVLVDPYYAYYYAKHILHGHDERVLKAVLVDPSFSNFYAQDILHGHDERLLKAVLKDPESAYEYAIMVYFPSGRFSPAEMEELEDAIATLKITKPKMYKKFKRTLLGYFPKFTTDPRIRDKYPFGGEMIKVTPKKSTKKNKKKNQSEDFGIFL